MTTPKALFYYKTRFFYRLVGVFLMIQDSRIFWVRGFECFGSKPSLLHSLESLTP